MDRGPSLFSLCVLVYCIFQTARFSNGDENACPCPEIPLVNLTETPPTDCFQIGERFRYTCKAGYVREAGTSNLIRCIQMGDVTEWTPRYLTCKRDPRRNTREPTNPPLIRDYTELRHVSIIPTTVTETTNIDTTSTGLMASQSLPGGKSDFVTKSTSVPTPPLTAENPNAEFASDPKYIVSPCVALVCLVALAGGIIYIFCKRRTSRVDQPLPAEQIPMANDPSELSQ